MNTRTIWAGLVAVGLFLFTSLVAPDVQAAPYSFTIFDAPGATYTSPASINASGQVTGYYSDGSRSHGFVYSDGTFTTLDVPNASGASPVSINASGQVTGSYPDSGGHIHGFVYSNGTFTILDAPSAIDTVARSINANGQVAGRYYDGSHTHGFVYSDGTFTTLDGTEATSGAFGLPIAITIRPVATKAADP